MGVGIVFVVLEVEDVLNLRVGVGDFDLVLLFWVGIYCVLLSICI